MTQDTTSSPWNKLNELIINTGGPEEFLSLLDDYRQIVGQLARSCEPGSYPSSARAIVESARNWWEPHKIMRIASDLPEYEGSLFMGAIDNNNRIGYD